MNSSELAKVIDHTALKPETTASQIKRICEEAIQYSFLAVCIPPCWVPLAAQVLSGGSVRIASVIGFPLGYATSTAKSHEVEEAVRSGASELDMVINVGLLKSGEIQACRDDIRAVVIAGKKRPSITIKVILETALLSNDEKKIACRISEEAGADFVKTSTGFGPAGATIEDVSLLRSQVGNRLGVKAAGGIRDLPTALAMLKAGATRIGCSSSVSIMSELKQGANHSPSENGY